MGVSPAGHIVIILLLGRDRLWWRPGRTLTWSSLTAFLQMKRQAFSVYRGIFALSAMAVASCLVSTARAFVTRPIVRSFPLRQPSRHFVASSVQCRAYAKGRPSIDDVERYVETALYTRKPDDLYGSMVM